tara:strand:- start:13093 stop:13614 length:522 start_codon:yes stop_codon:yes gene_type:complete
MLSIIYPPEPGTKEELNDFLATIKQYDNRLIPEELQESCDSGMEDLMAKYLLGYGIHISIQEAKETRRRPVKIIGILKNYFNRGRPDELAREYNIDWNDDYLESAQTSSYPSGHTIQAYYLAGVLGKSHPEHQENLFIIAAMVAQSRIDRGVHFPSDVEYGKIIAIELLNQLD